VIEEETAANAGGLDFEALRRGIEGRNPDLLLGFYSEDAELRIVNGDAPEGPTFELKGRAQIERYLRAVCNQEMTCLLEGEVVSGEGRITFGQRCAYPDGTLISVRTTLEIAEGKIQRQLDVAHSARDRPGARRGAKDEHDEHEARSTVGHNRRNEKGRNRDDYSVE
jgi:hypothetical protein